MPWGDWQFWVVTAAAAFALMLLARPLLPRRFRKRPKGTRAQLTIGGSKVERRTSKGERR